MNTSRLTLGLVALTIGIHSGLAQGTAFTYQGLLNDSNGPVTGSYDIRFAVHDALTDGALVAGPLTLSAVATSNGLFTVALDFGAGVFFGADRWLEVAVRTNGTHSFTTLVPRQPITAAPYALFARGVNASGINGAITSDLLADGAVTVSKLADASVTGDKLAANSVGAAQLSLDTASLARVSGGVMTASNGNIGIGVAPAQKLSVAGVIESTAGGVKFPDGTIQIRAATAGGLPDGLMEFMGTNVSVNRQTNTFVVPPEVTRLMVELWGAGGTGGGISGGSGIGAGGGAGGYSMKIFSVSPGQTYRVSPGNLGGTTNNLNTYFLAPDGTVLLFANGGRPGGVGIAATGGPGGTGDPSALLSRQGEQGEAIQGLDLGGGGFVHGVGGRPAAGSFAPKGAQGGDGNNTSSVGSGSPRPVGSGFVLIRW